MQNDSVHLYTPNAPAQRCQSMRGVCLAVRCPGDHLRSALHALFITEPCAHPSRAGSPSLYNQICRQGCFGCNIERAGRASDIRSPSLFDRAPNTTRPKTWSCIDGFNQCARGVCMARQWIHVLRAGHGRQFAGGFYRS